MKQKARSKLDERDLDEKLVYRNLRSIFPKVNDYGNPDYKEELIELRLFGIKTNKQLRLLLKKHRKQILAIDKSPMDSKLAAFYEQELGKEEFREHIRKNYWFAYPGLLRLALELEFGDEYEKFANERDGI